MLDVERRVPHGVVEARTGGPHARRALLQRPDLVERSLQALFVAEDADVQHHHLLQVLLDRERILAVDNLERLEHLAFGLDEQRGLRLGTRSQAQRVLRGREARSPPEDDEIGERVAAQAIGPVQARGRLARGVEPGHVRRRRLRLSTRMPPMK